MGENESTCPRVWNPKSHTRTIFIEVARSYGESRQCKVGLQTVINVTYSNRLRSRILLGISPKELSTSSRQSWKVHWQTQWIREEDSSNSAALENPRQMINSCLHQFIFRFLSFLFEEATRAFCSVRLTHCVTQWGVYVAWVFVVRSSCSQSDCRPPCPEFR